MKKTWAQTCYTLLRIRDVTPTHQNRCHKEFHFGPTDYFPKIEPLPNSNLSVPPTFISVPPKVSDQLSHMSISIIGNYDFWNWSHREFETVLGHWVGTTEIHIPVSPKIEKLPHLVQLDTTEIHFSVTKLGNNVVMVGFWEMPICHPPPPLIHRGSTQKTHTLTISISPRAIKRFQSIHLKLDF